MTGPATFVSNYSHSSSDSSKMKHNFETLFARSPYVITLTRNPPSNINQVDFNSDTQQKYPFPRRTRNLKQASRISQPHGHTPFARGSSCGVGVEVGVFSKWDSSAKWPRTPPPSIILASQSRSPVRLRNFSST